MLDGASLNQLRAFIAAVDEGSFSAAGHKLYRAQSTVSGLRAERQAGIFHEKSIFANDSIKVTIASDRAVLSARSNARPRKFSAPSS